MKSKPSRFPKELFITVESAGTDEEYLLPHGSVESLLLVGNEHVRTGRYVLEEIVFIERAQCAKPK